MAVDILQERVGGVLIATISGRLDNESSADFELFAQESVASGERHLVLDLAQLGYISNAGVRALGTLAKSLTTPTTSLRVAGVQPNVRQILDSAGVSILLDMHVSRVAAMSNHPAARGNDLAKHVLAVLGLPPATEAPPSSPAIVKLAETAFELMVGKQQNRAVKAIAQGTQVMRRVTASDAAGAKPAAAPLASAPKAAASDSLPWWKRLFGMKKMSAALAWPLLAAGLMPLLFTGIAKARGRSFDNSDPRSWQSRLTGLPQRAHAAHLNSFEAFPMFASAVLFALVRGVPEAAILPWAWAFIGLRLLFGALYIANYASARSVAWTLALACAVRILFLAP